MMVNMPACDIDPKNPGKGQTRPQQNQFNAAFAVGNTPNGNVACEINTIESMSGIFVDHTVVVGFSAFAKLTDDIGGVQVCVPKDVSNAGGDNITLKKGIQTVKGQTALDYVREREGLGDGSDIGRTRRQQAFLGSMIKKVESDGVMNDPTHAQRHLQRRAEVRAVRPGTGQPDRAVDLRRGDEGHQPRAHPVPDPAGPLPDPGRPGGDGPGGRRGDLEPPEVRHAAGRVERLRAPRRARRPPRPPSTSAPATTSAPPAPSISPSTISVRVENGTTVTGLATDATTSLQAQGYNAVVSHTIPPHTAVTTIIYSGSR